MLKFTTSRFHIEYGPKSLFDRVLFVMDETTTLKFHSKHFNSRCTDRNISEDILDQLVDFNINEWNVVTLEVRTDKGKFVKSTWEKIINGIRYWITIGYNNAIQTIVIKNSSGISKVIKDGELYYFVDKVNTELMLESLNSKLNNR